MRSVLVAILFVLGACRMPYMSDLADMTVIPEKFPPLGTNVAELDIWFERHGYAPGPRGYQAEASLRRRPGDPLVYALDADKMWWYTRSQSVRDLCVTQKTVYFRLDNAGSLVHAIQNHRSQC